MLQNQRDQPMSTEPPAADANDHAPRIEALSAVTLITRDLPRALRFYQDLGFELHFGDASSRLVSLAVGGSYLNLLAADGPDAVTGWGRVIIHVSDVDAFYARARQMGVWTEAPPRDAEWGERYFHLRDPDGHELSLARKLA
jgi:catechol 2,3-dioxygenase-like lactoylglutathione lyase family enzyme